MASKTALLIVDDDPLIAEGLSFALAGDFDIRACGSRLEAMSLLKNGAFQPRLALIDLGLPPVPDLPTEGFRLVGDLLAWSPDLRILVLSGQNEETHARRARALGATALVSKPCAPEDLKSRLLAALARPEWLSVVSTDADEHALIGESLPMRRLKSQIDLYAASTYPTLIEGESGSGKERVAAGLHYLSPRSKQPFLALNCAAISANLIEAALFGYAKGAFTGAQTAKAGYFEDAGTGTLFLDEIGELPLDLQPKLLRVLENGAFQRVGETSTRQSQARIIAATNRDLKAETRAGRFRADLYHRLSVFSIPVPPLRELGDDKLRLLDYFRHHLAPPGAEPFTLDPKAKDAWLLYPFPGNVRELKNIVIRLNARHAGYEVNESELLSEFAMPADVVITGIPVTQSLDPRADIEAASQFSLDDRLREIELRYIDAGIALCNGNMTQAAKRLGLSRSTLYSRLEALRPGATVASSVQTGSD